MNQQQPPLVKYLKSNDFDAVVEEYYHPTEKDAKGNPIFLNKRAIVSREEWVERKNKLQKEYAERMEFIAGIFKILDEKEKPKKKGK